jgi:hypothetical protein
MNRRLSFVALFLATLFSLSENSVLIAQSISTKPRTIVTTDGEVDDHQNVIIQQTLLYLSINPCIQSVAGHLSSVRSPYNFLVIGITRNLNT